MTIKSAAILLTAILFAMFFASCSSPSKEKTIHASGISLTGEGSGYIKVVDGDYVLEVVEDKIIIPIKFELIRKYDGSGVPNIRDITFTPLDKSGIPLDKPDVKTGEPRADLHTTPVEMSKIRGLLKSDIGNTAEISFTWPYYSSIPSVKNFFSGKNIKARIMKETESFKIISTANAINYSGADGGIEDDSNTISHSDTAEIIN